MATGGPVRLFLSYAHEDSRWCEAVLNHLGWLRHSGQVEAFHDRALKPGERWDDRIKRELTASEVVIALVSPHFMGSRYCCLDELQPAIDRQDRGEADLVPIVCDHVELGPLRAHQCLPQDENNDLKPLCDWPNANLPLARCAAKVRALVEARRPPPPATVAPPSPAPTPTSPSTGRPRARPSLADRLAAVVAGRIGGMLESVLRTTLGTRASLPLPTPHVPAPAQPPSEPGPPASTEPFVGRRTDLDQLALWLLDEVAEPVAVLGPGGIGKTTLTRAALRDPRCAAHYPEPGRRLFVPLEEIRDATGLYRAVASGLGLGAAESTDATVLAALAAAPTLLVLDNAETPWEADPTEVEAAFARLAAIPGIGLVASFRGFELPGDAAWRPLIVEPLVADASRELFLAIAGDRFAADPDLQELVARLDGLPLAIELVAHRAQAEPNARTVLRRWDAEKSAFLRRGEGGRKDLDLAVSLALSLASPRLTEPARRLFALLGRLPQGLARADLAAVMPDADEAAASALTATGLVLRDPDRLRMLAPVREFAAAQPLPERVALRMIEHFAALADALPWATQQPADPAAAALARAELANIDAVLAEAEPSRDPVALSRNSSRWIGVGDAWRTVGSLTQATRAFEQASNVNLTLSSRDPNNAAWQRALFISQSKVADVIVAQGNLRETVSAYEAVLATNQKLTAADPGNALWQRDLSISWEKLGDVRRAQGDLAGALQAYTESKNIRDQLAAADPGNALWQRDLSISWEKLASVQEAEGNGPAALASWREALSVSERLAREYPGSVDMQTTQVVHLAGIARHLDPTDAAARAEAKGLLDRCLAVLRPLAEAGRLDAQRQGWIAWIEAERAKLEEPSSP